MMELIIKFTETIRDATTVDELKECLIYCARIAAESYNKSLQAENLVRELLALDKARIARADELIKRSL